MIKNILFDMGGVILIQDTPAAFKRFQAAGLDTDVYMGHYGQKGFILDLEMGKIDEAEFCRQMAEVTGRSQMSVDEARDCWHSWFRGAPLERLHHLEELRGRFTLGLLSNTNPFIMDYADSENLSCEGKPMSAYFDYMFLSYKMGVCKPLAEIFVMALEQGGMFAEETLFVDDSLRNVEAAEACGIKGLHVVTNEDWWPQLTALIEADSLPD